MLNKNNKAIIYNAVKMLDTAEFRKFDDNKQRYILSNFIVWSISRKFNDKQTALKSYNAILEAWNNDNFTIQPNAQIYELVFQYPVFTQPKIYDLVRDSQNAVQNNDTELANSHLRELKDITTELKMSQIANDNARFSSKVGNFRYYKEETTTTKPQNNFDNAAARINEDDENLSAPIQIVLNGTNRDGRGGLSLANLYAENNHTKIAIDEQMEDLRKYDQLSGEYTYAYYLNAPEGAGFFGHSAIAIQKQDGSALFFSYYPNPEYGVSVVVATPGIMHFAVLNRERFEDLLNGTKQDTVGLYYKNWEMPIGWANVDDSMYVNYIKKPINLSEAENMITIAGNFITNSGTFGLLNWQCDDVANAIWFQNKRDNDTSIHDRIPTLSFTELVIEYELQKSTNNDVEIYINLEKSIQNLFGLKNM